MDVRRDRRWCRDHRSAHRGERRGVCGGGRAGNRCTACGINPAGVRAGAVVTTNTRGHRSGDPRPRVIARVGIDEGCDSPATSAIGLLRAPTARPTASPGLSLDAQPSVLTSASFESMGTTVVVAASDPAALALATSTVRAVVTAIDRTCSRFQSNSELSRLNRASGSGPVEVSELLDAAISASLDAAAATDGLVDPTIGALIERLGYTVTFTDMPLDGPSIDVDIRSAPGWASIVHDRDLRTFALPADASLDLGAVGKAWAADQAAGAAAWRVGAGVLVACGGDVAVAGPALIDGWRVRVSEDVGATRWQDVQIFDGGLATSGTESRTWRRGGEVLHHIIDPATGLPPVSPWLMASVAGATCAEANTAATCAIVLGEQAPAWLRDRGLPARLVHRDGSVLAVGPWPG